MFLCTISNLIAYVKPACMTAKVGICSYGMSTPIEPVDVNPKQLVYLTPEQHIDVKPKQHIDVTQHSMLMLTPNGMLMSTPNSMLVPAGASVSSTPLL